MDGATPRLGGVAPPAAPGKQQGSAWLSEADLDFFTGGGRGVGELESGSGVAPEDQGTLNVRSFPVQSLLRARVLPAR